jgi:hypothetical protein
MSADRAPEQRTAVGLLAALYVWEAAALGLAMAGYKYSNRLGSLNARQWAWIVGPAVAFVASAAYVIYCSLQSRRSARRWFLPTVALNLLPVTIMLVAGEIRSDLRGLHAARAVGRHLAAAEELGQVG